MEPLPGNRTASSRRCAKMLSLLLPLVALLLSVPQDAGCKSLSDAEALIPREKVVLMLTHMKQCADRSTEPDNMFRCSCEGDLLLSQIIPPHDSNSYCKGVTERNLQHIQLPEKEQLANAMETGAQDIRVTSLFIFLMTTPCLIKAIKADKQQDLERCYCVAYEITNRLNQASFSNSAELLMEASKILATPDLLQKCNQQHTVSPPPLNTAPIP